MTVARMFWVFGSLFLRRFRALRASCRGSGRLWSIYLFWTPAYFLIVCLVHYFFAVRTCYIFKGCAAIHTGRRATRVSSADADTGQGPHSTGDDPKTGHANFSKDLWWLVGKLVFLSWLWGVRPVALSVRSVFLWGSCGFVSFVGFAMSVLGSCFSKVRTASLQRANPRTGRSQCFTGADPKNGK